MFQETLKELFHSWEAMKRHREVIIFTAGLMTDPRPLVDFVYEYQIEENLQWMRTGDHNPSIDEGLFKSLCTESTVLLPYHPLHNKHINYYNHVTDNDKKRSKDTTPLHIPSKLFVFEDMAENVNIDYREQDTELTECAMRITWPHPSVTVRTLSICHRLSNHQVVSDLYMDGVRCQQLPAVEVPIMSTNAQSLFIYNCILPVGIVRNIFHQLSHCVTLQRLYLCDIDLKEVEDDLNILLENIILQHEAGLTLTPLKIVLGGIFIKSNLSEEFMENWMKRCAGIKGVECQIIDIGHSGHYGHYSHY